MIAPLSLALLPLASPSCAELSPTDPESRSNAAEALEISLEMADGHRGNSERRLLVLETGFGHALERLDPESRAASRLRESLRWSRVLSPEASGAAGDMLMRDAREMIGTLRFEPTMEAELPEGFPAPTALGEIEIKVYPSYRLAEAEMQRGNSTFWTLFNHIKENDIAMTAPVEMTYDAEDRREDSMAFLYASTRLGRAGDQGKVTVHDKAPMQVVSVGCRGMRTDRSVSEHRALLEAWLKANEDRFERTGPTRCLGYNSPWVPRSKQYYEVQIPIRSIESRSNQDHVERLISA